MLALVLDNGTPKVLSVARPERGPGEALIRVILAGICATDVEMTRGYSAGFNGILGHEFVGVVVDSENPGWIDRRVVGEINIGCGVCEFCTQGLPNHCLNRKALGISEQNGAFAEYVVLPQSNLFLVPDSLTDDQAVFTEPLAAALEIVNLVYIEQTDHIGVIGDGKLGLLVAQALAVLNYDVTLIGHHADRLELAAGWGINIRPPVDAFDVIVECTGNPGGFQKALELVRARGKIVLKSTYSGLAQADLTCIVVNEIQVIGNRCGPFEPALRLLNSGRINTKKLIEARYSLKEGVNALVHAGRSGALKILIQT